MPTSPALTLLDPGTRPSLAKFRRAGKFSDTMFVYGVEARRGKKILDRHGEPSRSFFANSLDPGRAASLRWELRKAACKAPKGSFRRDMPPVDHQSDISTYVACAWFAPDSALR